MELNNSNNAFEMTLLYPEARFIIIDIEWHMSDLKRLVSDGRYYDREISIDNARVLQVKSLTKSNVLVQYISKEDFAKYCHIGEASVGEKTYNVEMPTRNIDNGISKLSLGYNGMTLLYPEARIICIDIRNENDFNELVRDGHYYDIYSRFSINNARVLQIMPLIGSNVLVQYISEEDFVKYYKKNEESVNITGRERIISDIRAAKSIIEGIEVDGSLGSISILTKQLIADKDQFEDGYKSSLLSFLKTWESRICKHQEIDFLINVGYLNQDVKNSFADPLVTDLNVINTVYKLILDGLLNLSIKDYELGNTSNTSSYVKVINQ